MTRVRPQIDKRIGRPALGVSAVAAFVTLAGCGEGAVRISTSDGGDETRGVLKVIDTLQCPQTAGVLSRKGSAVAGGDTCVYVGPRGSEVVLSLVRLEGRSAQTVLADLERRTARDLAHTLARMNAAQTAREPEPAPAPAPAPEPAGPDDAESATSTPHTLIEAPGIRIESRGEDASVRLPGIRIEARGDQSSVRIGGLRIGSDKGSRESSIETADETVRIRAGEGSAEVRTHAPGGAVRATYVLSDDTPSPQGWRLVGFEARGPAGGPIVVAAVRSKEKREGELFDAARSLVTLNVGR